MADSEINIEAITRAQRTAVTELQRIHSSLEERVPEDPVLRVIWDDFNDAVVQMREGAEIDLTIESGDTLISHGLRSLAAIERRSFVLSNLMEAFKHDPEDEVDGGSAVRSFASLGLVGSSLEAVTLAMSFPGVKQVKRAWGELIDFLSRKAREVAFAAIQLVENALKLLPKFAKVKPIVGFSGPLPSISFVIEADGVSVDEIFESLRKGIV
jgi:hypothetical protein